MVLYQIFFYVAAVAAVAVAIASATAIASAIDKRILEIIIANAIPSVDN
jgi:hypothetical protein